MVELGLLLIVVAWIFQVARLLRGQKETHIIFFSLYSLGLLLLVIKGFNFGPITQSYLNMAALALSTLSIVLIKM